MAVANGTTYDAAANDEVMAYHCNFILQDGRPCAKRIVTGWVTNCSHLFCEMHAKEWFASNVECPVCRRGGGAVRVLKVDFQKSRKQPRTAMIGFLPTQVFQAAGDAFSFWVEQKMQEHDWQTDVGKKLVMRLSRLQGTFRERMAEISNIIGTLSTKKKRLNSRLSIVLAQGEQLSTQRDQLSQKLSQIQRRCSSLQSVHDGCKDTFERRKKERKGLRSDVGACEAHTRIGAMNMDTQDTPTSEMLSGLGLGLSSLACVSKACMKDATTGRCVLMWVHVRCTRGSVL